MDKDQHAARMREWRSKRLAEGQPEASGSVEQAIRAEIQPLSAYSERPGLVEVALALARVLDNQKAVSQWSAAAHRLSQLLDELHKDSAGAPTGKLAAVKSMTKRR